MNDPQPTSPEDVKSDLYSIMESLRNAEQPLQVHQLRDLGWRLSPAFNYISATAQKPSFENSIRRMQATEHLKKQATTQIADSMKEHRAFLEQYFDKADQQFKTLQLAGYAVFFAMWAFGRDWMSSAGQAWACLFMIMSATLFVLWEVTKTIIMGAIIRRKSARGKSDVESLLLQLDSFGSTDKAISFFGQWRFPVWLACAIFALAGIGSLAVQIVRGL